LTLALRRPATAAREAIRRARDTSDSAGGAVYPDEAGLEATVAMPASDEVGLPLNLIEASDADLIGRAAQGDARALEVLYDRYSGVVFSFALRIVADRQLAEEILQEAFFRAWQQGGNFSAGRGSFITWLLSITHNLSIDEIRKRRRRPQKADSEEPEQVLASVPDTGSGADVEDEVWLGALRETIGEALATLPPAQRQAIEMAYFRGMTQREISEALNEPLGTIKTRMRLGLQKLKDALGSDGAQLA
jgi:RNA polymerase sigma-70 factor (ECF subfamily)